MDLKDLEVYFLARELSRLAWEVYSSLHWEDKKIMGQQFIKSVDSIGANIAEGFGRYHYLDKIKFYYNARGSFNESCEHWLELLWERDRITKPLHEQIKTTSKKFIPKLNSLIQSTYKQKADDSK